MDDLIATFGTLSLRQRPATPNAPPELWLDILSRLNSRDLCATALVSRDLQRLAHSILFKSCVLRLRDRQRLRPMLAFYTSSDIAPRVQECTVLGHSHNRAADVALVAEAVLKFTNLSPLVFQYVRMTPITLATMSSTALSLQPSLTLICCMMDFPPPTESQAGTIRLKRFLLHNEHIPDFTHDARWLRFLDLHMLQVLDLQQPYSTQFFVEELIREPRIHFPALEVLLLHRGGLPHTFSSIFPAFPALRVLGIDIYYPAVNYDLHTPLDTPHDDTMPLLSSFREPVKHAAQYCTSRALMRHLKLYGDDSISSCDPAELSRAMLEIGRAAPRLTSLELRIAFPVEELTPTLFRAFPALRSLRVVVTHYPGRFAWTVFPESTNILHTLAVLALPSQLEVLYLAYRYGNGGAPSADVLQHSTVMTTTMIPAIRDLSRRSSGLRCISLCCDLNTDPWTFPIPVRRERGRTMIWGWMRDLSGDETMTQATVSGAECIDGRRPNMRIRDPEYEPYSVADALDDEWLEVTSVHRTP
ncbi:hypothetical protein B0H12DRAFT_374035 [Mycena haematopus]|nr:hypothetical protein B0H12DRAFT_374035 [Mycena haematopus]